MKQVFQELRTGLNKLYEIPSPSIKSNQILIRTRCSLISSGTEKMLVEFSKSNLISKAKKNPDKVSQVINKVKTDGPIATFEAVNHKLDQPLALGYCNVGVQKFHKILL